MYRECVLILRLTAHVLFKYFFKHRDTMTLITFSFVVVVLKSVPRPRENNNFALLGVLPDCLLYSLLVIVSRQRSRDALLQGDEGALEPHARRRARSQSGLAGNAAVSASREVNFYAPKSVVESVTD